MRGSCDCRRLLVAPRGGIGAQHPWVGSLSGAGAPGNALRSWNCAKAEQRVRKIAKTAAEVDRKSRRAGSLASLDPAAPATTRSRERHPWRPFPPRGRPHPAPGAPPAARPSRASAPFRRAIFPHSGTGRVQRTVPVNSQCQHSYLSKTPNGAEVQSI